MVQFFRRVGNDASVVDDGPVTLPEDWLQHVQSAETEAELTALRRSVVCRSPFGEEAWQECTAMRLGLGSTLRARGRLRKPSRARADLRLPTLFPSLRTGAGRSRGADKDAIAGVLRDAPSCHLFPL